MTPTGDLEARVVELAPQPTVAIRVSQPMAELDLGELFGTHLPNIADRVADLGGEVAGAPYGRYHAFGPEGVDVEVGIPVAAPVANLRSLEECEPGEVGASELPGGRVAMAVHRGPYDGLGGAHDRLADWMRDGGHPAGAGPWESYLDDPSETEDASQLRTEIFRPVAAD